MSTVQMLFCFVKLLFVAEWSVRGQHDKRCSSDEASSARPASATQRLCTEVSIYADADHDADADDYADADADAEAMSAPLAPASQRLHTEVTDTCF